MYQPDETIRLEVRLEDDTVWLTQAQMAELFQTTKNNVTLHIGNVYKEKELLAEATSKESLLVQVEGNRSVTRKRNIYNLDVIISVGYRVKSQRGTQFRQWANQVIKNYMLRGYSVNFQMRQLEQKDASIFDLLEKREHNVEATIYTEHFGQSLTHLQQLNQQQFGRRIEVREYNSRFHDRFLVLDDALYHFGASFKDLGKRLFAFELMGIDKNIILNQL